MSKVTCSIMERHDGRWGASLDPKNPKQFTIVGTRKEAVEACKDAFGDDCTITEFSKEKRPMIERLTIEGGKLVKACVDRRKPCS